MANVMLFAISLNTLTLPLSNGYHYEEKKQVFNLAKKDFSCDDKMTQYVRKDHVHGKEGS